MENVAVPLLILGEGRAKALARAQEMLSQSRVLRTRSTLPADPAFRRPAAARGHRPRPGARTEAHRLRRTDQRARRTRPAGGSWKSCGIRPFLPIARSSSSPMTTAFSILPTASRAWTTGGSPWLNRRFKWKDTIVFKKVDSAKHLTFPRYGGSGLSVRGGFMIRKYFIPPSPLPGFSSPSGPSAERQTRPPGQTHRRTGPLPLFHQDFRVRHRRGQHPQHRHRHACFRDRNPRLCFRRKQSQSGRSSIHP